ncbi:MAG: hypothetical protein IJA69_05180 [Clostridia bacterium]|nr:hypothetical protein [Clostridia bacterium]
MKSFIIENKNAQNEVVGKQTVSTGSTAHTVVFNLGTKFVAKIDLETNKLVLNNENGQFDSISTQKPTIVLDATKVKMDAKNDLTFTVDGKSTYKITGNAIIENDKPVKVFDEFFDVELPTEFFNDIENGKIDVASFPFQMFEALEESDNVQKLTAAKGKLNLVKINDRIFIGKGSQLIPLDKDSQNYYAFGSNSVIGFTIGGTKGVMGNKVAGIGFKGLSEQELEQIGKFIEGEDVDVKSKFKTANDLANQDIDYKRVNKQKDITKQATVMPSQPDEQIKKAEKERDDAEKAWLMTEDQLKQSQDENEELRNKIAELERQQKPGETTEQTDDKTTGDKPTDDKTTDDKTTDGQDKTDGITLVDPLPGQEETKETEELHPEEVTEDKDKPTDIVEQPEDEIVEDEKPTDIVEPAPDVVENEEKPTDVVEEETDVVEQQETDVVTQEQPPQVEDISRFTRRPIQPEEVTEEPVEVVQEQEPEETVVVAPVQEEIQEQPEGIQPVEPIEEVQEEVVEDQPQEEVIEETPVEEQPEQTEEVVVGEDDVVVTPTEDDDDDNGNNDGQSETTEETEEQPAEEQPAEETPAQEEQPHTPPQQTQQQERPQQQEEKKDKKEASRKLMPRWGSIAAFVLGVALLLAFILTGGGWPFLFAGIAVLGADGVLSFAEIKETKGKEKEKSNKRAYKKLIKSLDKQNEQTKQLVAQEIASLQTSLAQAEQLLAQQNLPQGERERLTSAKTALMTRIDSLKAYQGEMDCSLAAIKTSANKILTSTKKEREQIDQMITQQKQIFTEANTHITEMLAEDTNAISASVAAPVQEQQQPVQEQPAIHEEVVPAQEEVVTPVQDEVTEQIPQEQTVTQTQIEGLTQPQQEVYTRLESLKQSVERLNSSQQSKDFVLKELGENRAFLVEALKEAKSVEEAEQIKADIEVIESTMSSFEKAYDQTPQYYQEAQQTFDAYMQSELDLSQEQNQANADAIFDEMSEQIDSGLKVFDHFLKDLAQYNELFERRNGFTKAEPQAEAQQTQETEDPVSEP